MTVAPDTILGDPCPEVNLVHAVAHPIYTVELVVHVLYRCWLLPASTRVREVQNEVGRQHHHFYPRFEKQMEL